MLVNQPRRTGDDNKRAGDDTGSAIVSVLIVMILLSIMGLTAAAIVTNTTGSVVATRGSVQAKAAADAGITAALAQARRTSDFCSISLSGSQPTYTVTSSCASNQVTFLSTGRGTDGGTTRTQAVYAYTPTKDVGMGADMTFFDSATFTWEVKTVSPGNSLTVNIANGDFTCQVPVAAASVRVQGSFYTKGSCDIAGSVTAGGTIDMSNGSDTVRGNLTATGVSPWGGSATSRVAGSVGGDLSVGGAIQFGWEGKTIGGNVRATEGVTLGNMKLAKSLTFPTGKDYQTQNGSVAGNVSRPTSVSAPAAPTFDPWFEYAFQASDWPGYSILKLSKSGSGFGTCDSFRASSGTGWASLGTLTTPTVLDARACGNLSSNNGTHPSVALKTDLILLAKSFDLTRLTVSAASGASPKLRVIVEDTTKNSQPSCTNGAGDIYINGTSIAGGVTALAYTPCTIKVAGQLNLDRWNGSFYGGAFGYGGAFTFSSAPIALPGITGGAPVLGDLVSQRDIR